MRNRGELCVVGKGKPEYFSVFFGNENGKKFLGSLSLFKLGAAFYWLIFFTAARTGLWFGFVLKRRMLTKGCFS